MIFATTAHPLVHLNAALNSVATVLLIVGFLLIRRGRREAHAKTMIAAFGVSCLFLISYLAYHYIIRGGVKFTHPGPVRYVYFTILISHILLAITVPFLAIATILFGLTGTGARGAADLPIETRERLLARHRRLARVTFPIWLYVSITGVIVYVMLYHLWPPVAA